MDSEVDVPLMLPQRTTLPPEDTSTTTVEVMEQHAPIASTSKTVYQDTITSDPAPRSSAVPQIQSPGVHCPDQDMDSSVNGVSSQRTRSRSTSTSTSDRSRASYKGKERAVDESPHSPVLSQHASLLHLPDPFQVSEMERLKVENDLLRKQFAVLAKKARAQALTHSTSHETGNSTTTTSRVETSQVEHLNRMLRTSERQRKRLEKELRHLRSYLLSSVEPYRLPTPESEFDQDEDVSQSAIGDASAHPTYGSDNIVRQNGPRKRIDKDSIRSMKSKQTMGDAETEHLLLASARLARIHKVVDGHSLSASIQPPLAKRARRAGNLEHSESVETFLYPEHASMRLPPMPPPSRSAPDAPIPSSSSSPTQALPPAHNVLGSPIRTSRVKIEHESPGFSISNAARIFRPPSSNSAQPQAPPMQVSVSATSSGKGEKKIGRPLGSPNKTKLVPINRSTASRRRNTGTGHGNAVEAPTAGAGRPAGVFLSPTHRTRSGSSAQDLSDSVDGLLLAAQSLYGNERDADMGQDADEEWSTSKGDTGDNRHSLRQEESFEALNAVPYLPTTPASLDGPDMTRFPRAKPASSSAGLPATPGRMRVDSNGTVEPPQTPNTLARIERSALDVLAEEAASASKGPGMHTASRSLEALSGSARNLAQEMELARSLHDTSGFPGSNDAERRYSDHYSMPDGSQAFPEALGAAFSPHLHQGYPDTADQDYYDAPVPRTIAEQLAQGVDVSHPLIDPEDLQAGMTPAAALAKKSRSPYIKWTAEEDELLIQGVAEHGTKWEAVARLIPSRSYHQCRQRWLRGLKSGDALPANLQYLKPQIDAAVEAYEQARPGAVKKVES